MLIQDISQQSVVPLHDLGAEVSVGGKRYVYAQNGTGGTITAGAACADTGGLVLSNAIVAETRSRVVAYAQINVGTLYYAWFQTKGILPIMGTAGAAYLTGQGIVAISSTGLWNNYSRNRFSG